MVRGTKGIKIADPDRFAKKVNEIYRRADKVPFLPKIRKIGYNAFWFVWQITLNQGNLPLHEYGYLNRDEVAERFIKAVDSCSACPLGCKNTCEVLEGDFKGERSQTGHFLLA